MKTLARLIATCCYCGYAPAAPGTVGSLAAIALAWPLWRFAGFGPWAFLVLGLAAIAPAIWAADSVSRETGSSDPSIVVVDEVVGQWIALAGAARFNWRSWAGAFVLFRLFDVLKPPPARQFDHIPGGVGIVLDDVAAGVYAALVLFAAGWFNLY
ncbi:MAG TPA: phosphatidylglycerophosphatase A [Bryobacteraceae bacterium]